MLTDWLGSLVRMKGARSLAAVLVVVSIVGAITTSAGLFRLSDGLFVDGLTVLFRQEAATGVPVLQIEMPAPDQPIAPETWKAIFRGLEGIHSRLVVVINPTGDREMIVREAGGIGAEIVAPSLILRSAGGISRRQTLALERDGLSVTTVEGTVATRLGLVDAEREFLVDFRLDPTAFPLVSAEQFVAGRVDRQLVVDRVVLIGHALSQGSPGLTAFQLGENEISPLRFHAYAVASLLASSRLAEVGMIVSFLLIIAGAFLTGFWLTRFGDVVGRWGELGSYVAMVPVWAGAFAWGNLVLPYTAQILAGIVVSLSVRRQRNRTRSKAVGWMIRALTTQVCEGLIAKLPKDQKEHWARIVTMMTQVLDLKRMMFLEVLTGQHRVVEVAAHQCSIGDIKEPRRDYRRYPYTTALEAKGPILLEREFLIPIEDADIQYLAPLVFAGEVLGFWAFTIDKVCVGSFESQLRAVHHLVDQVAELLYERRVLAAVSEDSQTGSIPMEQHLADALHMVQHKGALVEGVLNSVHTATVVYDLFGNVLFISQGMSRLAERLKLDPYAMTALELVGVVTRLKSEIVRQMIRQVALGGERVTRPVADSIDGRTFVLSLSVVRQNSSIDHKSEGCTLALLCELIDVSEFRNGEQFLHMASVFLGVTLRSDLEAITLATSLLQDRRLSEMQRYQILGMLCVVIKRATANLNELHTSIENEEHDPATVIYPLNPVSLIHDILSSVRDDFTRSGIPIELECPHFCSLTRINASEFESGVKGVLELMKQDTRSGGVITIRVTEETEWFGIDIRNGGYGLPVESLQTILSSEEDGASSEFVAIRAFKRAVAGWGGEFLAESRVGEGFSFGIRLKR